MRHYARSRAWGEWQDFERWQPRVLQALGNADAPALSPVHLLSLPGISAAQQRQCATQWMADRLRDNGDDRALLAAEFEAAAACTPVSANALPSKIRLGYLSNDFHQHATALLIVEMLEAHDRTRFELHAYSYGADDGHGMRQRLQSRFDSFTDITALADMPAARAIHAAGIHILIDLKGYTAGTRTALLTYRQAPLQVSFLGYPGTR